MTSAFPGGSSDAEGREGPDPSPSDTTDDPSLCNLRSYSDNNAFALKERHPYGSMNQRASECSD